jgi:hypothetical protein
MHQIPHTSLTVRRKGDGYHSVILHGAEIAHAVKASTLSATYTTDGPALVTLTLAVDNFLVDERPYLEARP